MILPSKELLSDVFKKEVLTISDDTEWVEEKTGESLRENDICIIFAQIGYSSYIILDKHALAHKVKEWALENGYEIWSVSKNAEKYCKAQIEDIEQGTVAIKQANTEPEAIFQAGEWILGKLNG